MEYKILKLKVTLLNTATEKQLYNLWRKAWNEITYCDEGLCELILYDEDLYSNELEILNKLVKKLKFITLELDRRRLPYTKNGDLFCKLERSLDTGDRQG